MIESYDFYIRENPIFRKVINQAGFYTMKGFNVYSKDVTLLFIVFISNSQLNTFWYNSSEVNSEELYSSHFNKIRITLKEMNILIND